MVLSNPRHRRSRRKGSRRSKRNPGVATLKRPLGAITAGFKAKPIVNAGTIAAGAVANYYLRSQISSRFLPMANSGPASYALGLATAGSMLLVPKVGPQLFSGAMLEEVLRAIQQYIFPNVKLLGEYLESGGQSMNGMNEYLESGGVSMNGMGEYLTASELVGDDADVQPSANFDMEL